MRNKIQQISLLQRGNTGFTLIEVVIVIVILSVLTAVSVPVLIEQRRQAIISTIQSDVKSSVATIVTINNNEAGFIKTEDFLDNAAITGENNLILIFNGEAEGKIACIWGNHVFSEDDIVSYHYSSDTGKITEGGCVGYNSTIIVGTGPETDEEEETVPTNESPTPTATPPVPTAEPTSTPTGSPTSEPTASPTPTTTPSSQPTATPTPATTTPPTITNPSPTPTTPTTVVKPTPTPTPVVTQPPTIKEPVVTPSGSGNKAKYPVCHYSGGTWHLIMIAKSGVINGHAGHALDVIPPIAGAYSGNNWNSAGWEKFNKYCV